MNDARGAHRVDGFERAHEDEDEDDVVVANDASVESCTRGAVVFVVEIVRREKIKHVRGKEEMAERPVRVKTMVNADAIEVRDVLNVVRGDEDEEDKDEDDEEEEGKREENWSRRKENMKEKMSALLKLLYSMQESPRGVGVGRKMRWKFRGSDVGKFRARAKKNAGISERAENQERDGEEEKEFRMLKSDDKCGVFDYLELVKSMVKSVRLAAHPNTLLLMSSAASYGVGEKGVDIMVTTAEHAHENRAKGDVEGSVKPGRGRGRGGGRGRGL